MAHVRQLIQSADLQRSLADAASRLRVLVHRAASRLATATAGEDSLTNRSLSPRTLTGKSPVDIGDLLGRPAINLDSPELQRFLAGKRVLVTGAGGSIGAEICRQSMKFLPQRLILLEQAENALFEIDRELRHNWVGADILPYVADICDEQRIRQVFQVEQPQVVFHAAAHKHVPMMEHNAGEAIKTNVFGTKIVADAALASGVWAFVMVSTDKAVNPSSVMGATKRFAELYIQSLNGATQMRTEDCGLRTELKFNQQSAISSQQSTATQSSTRFVAVRFGNVLASSGSVVPIFQKQIEAGGPVTVTHPDMKRYFMTIPEASQLVMQAGAVAQGGEIFVLDMGQPIRILDLAKELIRRNGLRENDDIVIQFSGIRPGEKLYEELATDDEQTRATTHPKIRVWQLPPADGIRVSRGLEILQAATRGTTREAVRALSLCVPEYRPDGIGGKVLLPQKTQDPMPMRLVQADAQAA